jgi:ketosteroid isomerase-like protein
VRGIDDYMRAADEALAAFSGRRHEIEDLEIQLHGDIAVVYYVASWWFDDGAAERRLPLRSVDIYRREPDGRWNQCGSNISAIP